MDPNDRHTSSSADGGEYMRRVEKVTRCTLSSELIENVLECASSVWRVMERPRARGDLLDEDALGVRGAAVWGVVGKAAVAGTSSPISDGVAPAWPDAAGFPTVRPRLTNPMRSKVHWIQWRVQRRAPIHSAQEDSDI